MTGAASGIGRAAALLLAREGARVGLLGPAAGELEAVSREIGRAGGVALGLVADVADAPGMAQSVARLVQALGRLDIVFANAGINGVWAPIDQLKP